MDTLLGIAHIETQDDDIGIGAEPAVELLDIISVETHDDYILELVFENGEKRLFDMKPFLDKRPFVRLLNSPLFFKASVHYGTVTWPGNIDIAPETLWARSIPV